MSSMSKLRKGVPLSSQSKQIGHTAETDPVWGVLEGFSSRAALDRLMSVAGAGPTHRHSVL